MGYALFAGVVSGWRYFVLSNIVEDALVRELPTLTEQRTEQLMPGLSRRVEPEERLARVRDVVVRAAALADVPLAADEVTVATEGNRFIVRIRHEYPVLNYQAQKLAIPVMLERSVTLP